jgi:predicted transcriptional regulator
LYYEVIMALTVRLNPRTERALNAAAKRRKLSRSDVVREALVQYEASTSAAAGAPYDAWIDVIGVIDRGVRDYTRTTGEQFSDLLRKQARARRPR